MKFQILITVRPLSLSLNRLKGEAVTENRVYPKDSMIEGGAALKPLMLIIISVSSGSLLIIHLHRIRIMLIMIIIINNQGPGYSLSSSIITILT